MHCIGNCDCLCKCCKNQGIPNKCVYQPIESVGTNNTHEKLMIVEALECANYTKQLADCRSQCVSGIKILIPFYIRISLSIKVCMYVNGSNF